MKPVKIDAFLSVPACSGGVNLTRLLDSIHEEYGDRVEIVIHRGRDEMYETNKITAAPALIIGNLVRIMGLCPSRESLIAALQEGGLE